MRQPGAGRLEHRRGGRGVHTAPEQDSLAHERHRQPCPIVGRDTLGRRERRLGGIEPAERLQRLGLEHQRLTTGRVAQGGCRQALHGLHVVHGAGLLCCREQLGGRHLDARVQLPPCEPQLVARGGVRAQRANRVAEVGPPAQRRHASAQQRGEQRLHQAHVHRRRVLLAADESAVIERHCGVAQIEPLQRPYVDRLADCQELEHAAFGRGDPVEVGVEDRREPRGRNEAPGERPDVLLEFDGAGGDAARDHLTEEQRVAAAGDEQLVGQRSVDSAGQEVGDALLRVVPAESPDRDAPDGAAALDGGDGFGHGIARPDRRHDGRELAGQQRAQQRQRRLVEPAHVIHRRDVALGAATERRDPLANAVEHREGLDVAADGWQGNRQDVSQGGVRAGGGAARGDDPVGRPSRSGEPVEDRVEHGRRARAGLVGHEQHAVAAGVGEGAQRRGDLALPPDDPRLAHSPPLCQPPVRPEVAEQRLSGGE